MKYRDIYPRATNFWRQRVFLRDIVLCTYLALACFPRLLITVGVLLFCRIFPMLTGCIFFAQLFRAS